MEKKKNVSRREALKKLGMVTLGGAVLPKMLLSQNETKGISNLIRRQKAPNIIILFADDLGYGDLSCYGHPTIQTPNLDRMAAEGVKLSQFCVGASVCTPSRAALLTGRLPVRYGMAGGVIFPNTKWGLPTKEITIASALKTKGYATGCFGKWHLGNQSPYLPTDHGFDYFYGIPYSDDMSPKTNPTGLGAQYFPPIPLMRNDKVIEQPVSLDTLGPKIHTEAIKFIHEHRSQPFFLYFPYTNPHNPPHPSKEFRGKSLRGLYGDAVQEVDWSVGEMLKDLKKLHLEEDTFVFFTSDNGPWMYWKEDGGSAGMLRGQKATGWEGGFREPAIAWWPGHIRKGVLSGAIASSMDLFTTALSLAGVEVPKDRIIDGVNLMPLLTGEKQTVRDELFYYVNNKLFAVRKGPWKLHFHTKAKWSSRIENHGGQPWLFNLDKDPGEKYNLTRRSVEYHVHNPYTKEINNILQVVKKHLATLKKGN